MKIPNKIQIAGKEIKVKRDTKALHADGLIGQNRSEENEILIPDENSYLEKQSIEEIFIHEVLHKINNVLGKSDTEFNKENYICPLSELLYQVIKQL